MSILEVVLALAILGVVLAAGSQLIVGQATERAAIAVRNNAEDMVHLAVSRLEAEYKTSLIGDAGSILTSATNFSINRSIPSQPAKYSRVTYKVVCQTLPNDSAIKKAGFTLFPPPKDCNDVVCPANQRPVVERTFYSNFSSSTSSVKTFLPEYDGTSKYPGGVFQNTLGLTMCIKSPLNTEDVIAGFIYAYYTNTTHQIVTVKRQFLVSKSPTPSGIQLVPN